MLLIRIACEIGTAGDSWCVAVGGCECRVATCTHHAHLCMHAHIRSHFLLCGALSPRSRLSRRFLVPPARTARAQRYPLAAFVPLCCTAHIGRCLLLWSFILRCLCPFLSAGFFRLPAVCGASFVPRLGLAVSSSPLRVCVQLLSFVLSCLLCRWLVLV